MAITFIATHIKPAIGDRCFYRAIFFVGVRAVGKATTIDKRPYIAEQPRNFLRSDIPQLELANAGCVDDKSSKGKWQQLCRCRGMPAFLRLGAHRRGSQGQTGFDRVEDREGWLASGLLFLARHGSRRESVVIYGSENFPSIALGISVKTPSVWPDMRVVMNWAIAA